MPSETHPMYVSRELARQLREDPVASAQIREHIPIAELVQLLGLTGDDLFLYLRQHEADLVGWDNE